MTLIFRLIIRRDIWIFHSKVFSSGHLKTLKVDQYKKKQRNINAEQVNFLRTYNAKKCKAL